MSIFLTIFWSFGDASLYFQNHTNEIFGQMPTKESILFLSTILILPCEEWRVQHWIERVPYHTQEVLRLEGIMRDIPL